MKAPVLLVCLILCATAANASTFSATLGALCQTSGNSVGCSFASLFSATGNLPGATDDVILTANAAGTYVVTIANNLEVNSLTIVSNAANNAAATVAVAKGAALTTVGNIQVTANSAIQVLGSVVTNGVATISGAVIVSGGASVTFNGGSTIGATSNFQLSGTAIAFLEGGVHTIYGTITATQGSAIKFANANVNFLGTLIADATSTAEADTATVIFDVRATVSGTITLLNNAYIATSDDIVSLEAVAVTGINNTLEGAHDKYVQITSTLAVAQGAALRLVGNVVAQGVATVDGTLTTAYNAALATAAYAQFQAGVIAATSAQIYVGASTTITTGAQSTISGTVTFARNAQVTANSAALFISNVVVTDANALISSLTGATAHLEQTVTVQAQATLIFIGTIYVDAVTTVSGAMTIGANAAGASGTTTVYFSAVINVLTGAVFTVSSGAQAIFNAGAFINRLL